MELLQDHGVPKSPTWLLDHKRDVFSQTGEDGIIEKILELIPDRNEWCVEFGAWDGLFLTNTRNLIESAGYSAVLIEADPNRFEQLERNYADQKRVIPVNRFVGFGKDDNLDQILHSTAAPVDFDFLSIDIDGNDFHVWKAMEQYTPKVVVIEFNPTIPTEVSFVQPADPSINHGASLKALVELGIQKGYELVAVLPFNAFFVRAKYFHLFGMATNAPEVLRTNLEDITYIFSGYDGQVLLRGSRRLPWHGIALKESRVQPLPRMLRRHRGAYTSFQRLMFALYLLRTNPRKLFGRRDRPGSQTSESLNARQQWES